MHNEFDLKIGLKENSTKNKNASEIPVRFLYFKITTVLREKVKQPCSAPRNSQPVTRNSQPVSRHRQKPHYNYNSNT